MTDADLVECVRLHPAKLGAESIGEERAIRAWRSIRDDDDVSKSALVERFSSGKSEIVGFGISVFVMLKFAEAEIVNPQPGLNKRIIESIDGGRPVIATFNELRRANTQGNLQQVILYTSWKRAALTPKEVGIVRYLLPSAYQKLHAGYRFGRILTELVDTGDLQHAADIRALPIVSRFEEFHSAHPDSCWNRERGLAMADGESLSADPASIGNGLFQHRRPVFGFTAGEQKLLERALEGGNDHELAQQLGRTVPAIKQRWAHIFERVARIAPELCPIGAGDKRGPQKRNQILTYVRENPEELRPFEFG